MQKEDERTLVSFDWAMKHILRDKANFDVLEGFLSTLLGEEIRILSLLESEANQQTDLDKYNRVDLLTEDAEGRLLVVEIQHGWQHSYLKRLLYGTAKLIVDNLKLGQSYETVRKVISISILYFPFGAGEDDYLYHGQTAFYGLNSGKQLPIDLRESPAERRQRSKTGKEKEKSVNIFPEYYLIEVEQFQNIIRQPIDEWIYLFKNSQVRDDFHSKNIQAAKEKLALLHMNPEERSGYEAFLLSRASSLDLLESKFKEGKAEGLQQGLEQGKEQTQRENARRMQAKGFDVATIREITGLTEQEIEGL